MIATEMKVVLLSYLRFLFKYNLCFLMLLVTPKKKKSYMHSLKVVALSLLHQI